jgi:hypothetical protein
MVWPTNFEPPPQRGPPPNIPLPKPPIQRSDPVSMSQPPVNEYFKNINYSPATPPRIPPRANIRPPALHRVSETDSLEEADEFEPPAPIFKSTSNGSPVSPYTIVEPDGTFPAPNVFELDMAARMASDSNAGTSFSSQSYRQRARSSFTDDDDSPPFIVRSDKHKRILGIDQKTSQIKRVPHEKKDASTSVPPGPRRKRSFPDINDRSNSPLPTPEVVPFLYQDIEVCPLSLSPLTFLGCTKATRNRSARSSSSSLGYARPSTQYLDILNPLE